MVTFLDEKQTALSLHDRVDVLVANTFARQAANPLASTRSRIAPAATSQLKVAQLRWAIYKRIVDVVVAAALIVFISPVLLGIALLIKMETPGPILFRQPRRGRDNRLFQCLKFRTMHQHLTDLQAARQSCRNDRRVTRVGAVLRRYSLDELPQLFNVLAGDMSLVGPRPHTPGTSIEGLPLEVVSPLYLSRYQVRPGLTGLAQTHRCRGPLNTVQQLRRRLTYDRFYIRHWSPWLDFLILLRTAWLIWHDDAF